MINWTYNRISPNKQAKEIEESNASSIVDAPSHGHLELCSRVMSAYNNLLPVIGDKDSTLEFISKAMMNGVNSEV
ncbi:MAG: hypothetical protein WD000_10345 [Thermodesulfobacteriota bacterium]